MYGWAVIKAVSFGYLLGALALSLAALGWLLLRPLVAPRLRAAVLFYSITVSALLNLVATVLIYVGVITGAITMTTSLFHRLMYGGWATVITVSGFVLLGLSFIIALVSWRRGRAPSGRQEESPAGLQWDENIPALFTPAVATLSLVGTWRMRLWINRAFWERLTPRQQQLALEHERCHLRRSDNQRKLLLHALGALYGWLPWVVRLAQQYELESEIAVDGECSANNGQDEYVRLIALCCRHQFEPVPEATVNSRLSAAELGYRLEQLSSTHLEAASSNARVAVSLSAIIAVFSLVPAILLVSGSLSRCLIACYLGF